jgi:chaperonin GroEL (HSP60 family)
LDAGANVVLTSKGLDDMAAKYFVEQGAIGVRRCKPEVCLFVKHCSQKSKKQKKKKM